MTTSADELREQVRRRYAESARRVTSESEGCGCGSGSCCAGDAGDAPKFGEVLYDAEQHGELPGAAILASLGCGNPTAVADLHAGETVLDLGSGGGIDVILSAKRVGPTGLVYGLDMTDEMLALARANASGARITNAIFLKGIIEEVPLPAVSVDVVISNCVINLSTDKASVLAEIARVLRRGGRVGPTRHDGQEADDRSESSDNTETIHSDVRAKGTNAGSCRSDAELNRTHRPHELHSLCRRCATCSMHSVPDNDARHFHGTTVMVAVSVKPRYVP